MNKFNKNDVINLDGKAWIIISAPQDEVTNFYKIKELIAKNQNTPREEKQIDPTYMHEHATKAGTAAYGGRKTRRKKLRKKRRKTNRRKTNRRR